MVAVGVFAFVKSYTDLVASASSGRCGLVILVILVGSVRLWSFGRGPSEDTRQETLACGEKRRQIPLKKSFHLSHTDLRIYRN